MPGDPPAPCCLAIPAGIFHWFKTGTLKIHSQLFCHGARVFFHSAAKFSLKRLCTATVPLEKEERGLGSRQQEANFSLAVGRQGACWPTPYKPVTAILLTPFPLPRTHCFCMLDNANNSFILTNQPTTTNQHLLRAMHSSRLWGHNDEQKRWTSHPRGADGQGTGNKQNYRRYLLKKIKQERRQTWGGGAI